MTGTLEGKVALVAGATRGAGRAIAIELGRAGAYVYSTGRSSRVEGLSEIGRPETIEETGDMIRDAGGDGRSLVVDHLDIQSVRILASRIEREKGRLDILVNDIFGGDRYMEWDKRIWEHDISGGLRMLQMGVHTHLITSAIMLPLLIESKNGLIIEMTDGTSEYNRNFRKDVGLYYDLVKASVERITMGISTELKGEPCSIIGVTPGWLRSEAMLEHFGVRESNWRDAIEKEPHFCISESPFFVGRGVAALVSDRNASDWSGKILSSADLARMYNVTDTDGTVPDCWKYLVEIQDKGLPATEVGYRTVP